MTWFKILRAAIITATGAITVATVLTATGLVTGSEDAIDIGAVISTTCTFICMIAVGLMTEMINKSYHRAQAFTKGALERAGLEKDPQGYTITPPLCATCGDPVDGYTGRFDSDRRNTTWLTQNNLPCGHEAFRHAMITSPAW